MQLVGCVLRIAATTTSHLYKCGVFGVLEYWMLFFSAVKRQIDWKCGGAKECNSWLKEDLGKALDKLDSISYQASFGSRCYFLYFSTK